MQSRSTSQTPFKVGLSCDVCEAGVQAVKTYIEIAGNDKREDAIYEKTLTALMALHLYKLLRGSEHYKVRTEVSYERIAENLLLEVNKKEIGNCTADIVLYQNRQPVVIIEAKKLSDGTGKLEQVVKDLDKGATLAKSIHFYAAALICETENYDLKQQKNRLEDAFKRQVVFSDPPEGTCTGEAWQWCFGCTKY